MTGFRSQKWDPWLIISQIIAVQTLYYLGLGLGVFFITLPLNGVPTLDYLFSYDVKINEILFLKIYFFIF